MKYTKAIQKPTQRNIIKKKKIINKINLKSNAQFLLIALESKSVKPEELKTLYYIINKALKKQNTLKFDAFPHFNWSKKPIEIRMGRGKGAISTELYKSQIGFPIFSLITSQKKEIVLTALKQCQYKLNIKTKIICNPFIF